MLSHVLNQLSLGQNTCTRSASKNEAEVDGLCGICDSSDSITTSFDLWCSVIIVIILCLLSVLRCFLLLEQLEVLLSLVLLHLGNTDTSVLSLVTILVVFLLVLLSAARESCEEVNVAVVWGHCAHIILHFQELVELGLLVPLVCEENLLSVRGHTVTSEELHEQNLVVAILFSNCTDFLEFVLPLVDSGHVVSHLIEVFDLLLLMNSEAVIVQETIAGFDMRFPSHLDVLVWLLAHWFCVHTMVIITNELHDLIAIMWQGKQVHVVWSHTKVVDDIVDSLSSIVHDCRQVVHSLISALKHELLESLVHDLILASFKLCEGFLLPCNIFLKLSDDLFALFRKFQLGALVVVLADLVELGKSEHEDVLVGVHEVLVLVKLEHRHRSSHLVFFSFRKINYKSHN